MVTHVMTLAKALSYVSSAGHYVTTSGGWAGATEPIRHDPLNKFCCHSLFTYKGEGMYVYPLSM